MTKKALINKNYVEYMEGSLPIILSAPHGGVLKPKEVKTRTSGVFDMDTNSAELTHEIINEFFVQINQYPHAIIMNLCRTKIDANRTLTDATSSCQNSIDSYHSFHHFIQTARQQVEKKYTKGLYIDIHGQSHAHGHIEFGYLLHNNILKNSDEVLEQYKDFSSIKTISDYSPYSFVEQIKGEFSLSQLMQNHGFDAMPSQQMPYAKCGDYFEGAFNTQYYSSQSGSGVSAIQAEFPFKGCRDSKKNRQACAKAFVTTLLTFMDKHFNLQL